MNALEQRDELFSRLHAEVLKERGFKKRGHWATRDFGTHVQSFHLRASRFGGREGAIFWIDVQVVSETWLKLVFPERVYKGPAEGTPSLFLRELGSWMDPPQASHRISREADLVPLLSFASEAATIHALPFLDACTSFEGLLGQLPKQEGVGSRHLVMAGLSRMLGREEQARYHMDLAIREAKHDSELQFLRLREESIWRAAA